MKIFITGATGFIGTHLVKRLTQTEHTLYCLVRNTSNTQDLSELGVNIITGDVTDKDSLLKGIKGCDWIVNLANIYSFWVPNRQIFMDINIEGTRNILICALETGVSKVVHVSTALTYGKPVESSFNEESLIVPVHLSEYARTKYEGDLIALDLYKDKGLPLVLVLPGAVLGSGDLKPSGQYIQNLIHRRMPGTVFNDTILTWVHVSDVAEAIVRALEKNNNIGEKYLVGKYQMSFQEINEMISKVSGVRLPKLRLPDFLVKLNAIILTGLAKVTKKPPMFGMSIDQIRTMKEGFSFDGSKAEKELGFTYTPIRSALEEAIASY
jgi:dihydroflavonol-4-reductase